MLAGLWLAFADKVAARPTIPTGTLTVGTQTLAGVPFQFRELLEIESEVQRNKFNVVMPVLLEVTATLPVVAAYVVGDQQEALLNARALH